MYENKKKALELGYQQLRIRKDGSSFTERLLWEVTDDHKCHNCIKCRKGKVVREFVIYISKLSKTCKNCNDYHRKENERHKRCKFKDEWYLIRNMED